MPLNSTKLKKSIKNLTQYEKELLNIYIEEAHFFYSVITKELSESNMKILDIGSGIGLLSRMVSEKGHLVISLEPSTSGFGMMKKFKSIIDECYDSDLEAPIFYDLTIEDFLHKKVSKETRFNYVYCINVIEHVKNLEIFISSVIRNLDNNGVFRIICPNYIIPYEPHFNFLTFFSKKITFFIQKRKILSSKIENPISFWEDLSFPTVFKLDKIIKKQMLQITYSSDMTLLYLHRITHDKDFIKRKKVLSLISTKTSFFLEFVFMTLSKTLLPVIDATIIKRNKAQ